MDIQAEKIELLLENQKEYLLKKVKDLLKSEVDNAYLELSLAHKNELDKRLERLEKGKTKFYTWEEVEEKLSKAL